MGLLATFRFFGFGRGADAERVLDDIAPAVPARRRGGVGRRGGGAGRRGGRRDLQVGAAVGALAFGSHYAWALPSALQTHGVTQHLHVRIHFRPCLRKVELAARAAE
eukprot:2330765-Pyramimonas_sp.AAC.1